MALSQSANALSRGFKQLQNRLSALTIRQLLVLWPALDFENIDASWPALQAGLLGLVEARRRDSSGLAASYYVEFRAAERITGRVSPVLADPIPQALSATGLTIRGPYVAKHLLSLKDPQAEAKTLTHLVGEVDRQVMNGGRDTVIANVDADPKAVGFSRFADADCCAFCAMLASRGPVYLSEASAGFEPHFKCGCEPEPWFGQRGAWPENGRKFQEQWNETTKGLSGKEARLAFRQAHEGRS